MKKSLENFKNQMLSKEQMKNVKGGEWCSVTPAGSRTAIAVWHRQSDDTYHINNGNGTWTQRLAQPGDTLRC